MRIIEHEQFRQQSKRRGSGKEKLILLIVVVSMACLAAYLKFGQPVTNRPPAPAKEVQPAAKMEPVAPPKLKTFTGKEFKQLYSSFAYPNTQPLTEKPDITGNEKADKIIRQIAEARGYKLSSVPVANIVKINEPYLTDDDLIQPNALIAWQDLKSAAKKAGIPLQITSAYRSIEFQRGLFMRRLAEAGITVFGIADGYSDIAVEQVLSRAAPPGYSRHHNGYTIDLACDGIGLEAFITTSCYAWLSKNNFENVKKFGLVPSYPEEASKQGPEPEAWEYIWVGKESLYE